MSPKPALTDPEMLAAHDDAVRRGVGWIRLLRITTGATGHLRIQRVDPSLVVLLDDPTVYLDQLRALVLRLPCSTCHVEPDRPCVALPSGRPTMFHVARSRPVYESWRLGHRDGLVDAFRRLTGDWDTPAAELLRENGAKW